MNKSILMLVALIAMMAIIVSAKSETFMIPMRDGVKLHTIIDFPIGYDPAKPTKQVAACYDQSPYGEGRTEMIADVCLVYGRRLTQTA
jgi:predicted acyl esterase